MPKPPLEAGKGMPIYVLKWYHAVVPTDGRVWHLGREVAFEAVSDQRAVTYAENERPGGSYPYGVLAVLYDEDGRRIWKNDTAPERTSPPLAWPSDAPAKSSYW